MERSPTDSGASSELAWRDDLTGAWNRRYLRRLLTEEWPGLVAAQGTMTLLVLDLDGFKPINDNFGHQAGDRVLRWAADELRRGFREEDRLIRYGGDEFVVALSDVGVSEARSLAERARSGFGTVTLDEPRSGRSVEVPISFSIGIASFPEDGASGDEVLAVADQRLYDEKRRRRPATADPARGRRRLVVASMAALGVALLAGGLAIREARKAPPIPAFGIGGAPESAALGSPAGGEVPPDEAALQLLRDEVASLREALAKERVSDERASYEERIRELEALLASAAAASPPDAAHPEIESTSGLRIGERRQRETLPDPMPDARGAAPPQLVAPAPTEDPAQGAASSTLEELPRLLQAPRPTYPRQARERRRQGTVELRVTISPEGKVTAVERIGALLGLGLDEAARDAAFKARYSPGTRDGVPVEMTTTLAIRFQLEGPPPR